MKYDGKGASECANRGLRGIAQRASSEKPFSDWRQSSESFRPPFLKGGAVKGAKPLSRSAERETPLRRFLFAALRSKVCFSLCAYMVKEKASFGIVLFWGVTPFVYSLRASSEKPFFFIFRNNALPRTGGYA